MMAVIHDRINKKIGVEIKSKIRSRSYVNGRMVFIKICIHKGYSKQEISNYLDVHHSSILYALNHFDSYIYQDDKLKDTYQEMYDFFMSFNLLQKVDELTYTIKNLENQIKQLKLHNIKPTKH
jgi:hypothetical protein